MPLNKNVGYGQAQVTTGLVNTGKTFLVVGSSGASYQDLIALWTPDNDGVARIFTSVADALGQTVAGRGDVVVLAPDFTTAFTSAQVITCETNGVTVVHGGLNRNGVYFCERATAALPQSANSAIFTVTGKIKLTSIQGVVTTQIQTQATQATLKAASTLSNIVPTDICASADISAVSVNAVLVPLSVNATFGVSLANSATGWSPTALQIANTSAFLFQITPCVIQAGTINLSTGASSTGSIKWRIEYAPLEPGARVFAA